MNDTSYRIEWYRTTDGSIFEWKGIYPTMDELIPVTYRRIER